MEDDKPKYEDDDVKRLSDKVLLRFIVVLFVLVTYVFIFLKVVFLS
jgi:cell division protein FtsL